MSEIGGVTSCGNVTGTNSDTDFAFCEIRSPSFPAKMVPPHWGTKKDRFLSGKVIQDLSKLNKFEILMGCGIGVHAVLHDQQATGEGTG